MSHTMRILRYGRREVAYTIRLRDRRTLGIDVFPNMAVQVTAPTGTPLSEIEGRVRNRAPWVFRQLNYFQRFLPDLPPRRYVGGETHRYLGRSYILKISKAETRSVKMDGRIIRINLPGIVESQQVRKDLSRWYRSKATSRFEKVVEEQITRFRLPRSKVKRVQVRQMKTRWGSMSPHGTLSLNLRLVEAPTVCIEYVVAHEVCHLLFPHHGKAFYTALSRRMPDWSTRKRRLELFFGAASN